VYNEEHNYNDQVKEDEMGREKSNAYRVLVGKPKGKILLRRYTLR
jgi:hypothetical protein